MSPTSNRGQEDDSLNVIVYLIGEIEFAWQLFRDGRVPAYAKILPVIFVLLYVLSPIDLIPDPILGLGQLDDLGVFLLGLVIFRALVPDYIKQEYNRVRGNVKTDPRQAVIKIRITSMRNIASCMMISEDSLGAGPIGE